MVCKKKTRFTIQFFIVITNLLFGFYSWSAEKIDPLPSAPPPAEGFLFYKTTPKEKDDTYQYLNKQDNPNQNMDSTSKNYESGKSRAQQMVQMLQNQELTKAFEKITGRSNKMLDENPEIKTPLTIIASAASFWFGRTINLIREADLKITANMEGRSQRSEFSMSSPLLNGKFKFDAKEGFGVGLNKSIFNLQAEAGVQYNLRDQVLSTEIRKKLTPNLDLSFGASSLDQNTKLEYKYNF